MMSTTALIFLLKHNRKATNSLLDNKTHDDWMRMETDTVYVDIIMFTSWG